MSDRPLVVYHKLADTLACSDGFGAAFVFWLKHGTYYEYMPAFYYKQIPIKTFAGREVIFVDFAYSADIMDEIYSVSKSLIVLEHHKTTMIALGTKPYAKIDLNKSGSLMAWEYVFPDKLFPTMLMHVMDHDLHLHRNANTKAFIQRLRNLPIDFEVWQRYMHRLEDTTSDDYQTFVTDGELLLNEHERRCEILADSAFPIVLAGVNGLAVNANKFYSHDVGALLAQRSGTFGASFYFRPDNCVEFSLSSVGDFDVEKIAFRYNGGGHANASGFSIPITSFSSIVDLSSKNVSFYLNLQAHIEEFCKTYTAPEFSTSASTKIAQDLACFLSSKLGSVVDELEIHVTAGSPKSNLSAPTRVAYFVAKLFKLPFRSTTPRWYHKFLCYRIRNIAVYDDGQISELLELAKSSDRAETADFVVSNLLQTVKHTYEAVIPDLTRYEASIKVCFPNSNFFVHHPVTF